MTPRPPLVPFARPMRLGRDFDNPYGHQRGDHARASIFVVVAVMRQLRVTRLNEGTFGWSAAERSVQVVGQSWTHRVCGRVNAIIGDDP